MYLQDKGALGRWWVQGIKCQKEQASVLCLMTLVLHDDYSYSHGPTLQNC